MGGDDDESGLGEGATTKTQQPPNPSLSAYLACVFFALMDYKEHFKYSVKYGIEIACYSYFHQSFF